jgi:hypothetical protein
MNRPNDLRTALTGRYTIEREAGSGGMATVYLAHDVRHDRQVAIKVLHEDLGATLGPERFLAEIKTTAKLQHPHILSLLDSGNAAGLLYYVMPYVEGETLRGRLTRETQLPIEDAVRIAREVADALGFAHGHGIVHRDIKPENILLQGGHALVADFGIALAVHHAGGTRMTQTGLSLGTPQYMSPEQAMGEKSVDHRGDIYALGAMTYEMLTGDPPFTGSSVQAIVAKVLSSEPEPLTTTRKTIPAHVEAAVLKALAKLPADRFATATQFAEALQQPGFATVAGRAAVPGEARRARRSRALTVTAIAVSVASLAFAVWTASRATAAANEPRFFDLALPDTSPIAFAGPAVLGIWQRALAVARDGRTIAYIARKAGGVTRVVVRHLDSGGWREFPGTEGAYHPFFSPNGQWVAFFVGSELRRVPVGGGTASVLASGVYLPVGAEWVSPESIFVAANEGSRPMWVSPSGKSPDSLPRSCGHLSARFCRVMAPQVTPDPEWMIGTSWDRLSVLSLSDARVFLGSTGGRDAASDSQPSTPVRGNSFSYLTTGHVLFTSGTELHAAKFDLASRRIAGPVFPVLNGIRHELTYPFSQYALGDDGTLAYVAGADSRVAVLAWVDAAGRRDTVPLAAGMYSQLSVSPAGELASITSATGGGGASVVILDTKDGRQVRSLPFGSDLLPFATWHPAGGLIISVADTGTARRRTVRLPSVASGNMEAISGRWDRAYVSPDQKWVARLTSDTTPTLHSLLDSTVAPVSIAPASWSGSFSPNSRWLAFTASGSRIVIIPVPYDGRRFEIATDGGEQPRWFPDGRRLAFKRGREILVVDLDFRDGGVVPSRPRRYVEGPFPRVSGWAYDIGPDARVLTFVNAEEESSPVIRIITNFPEFLRQKERQSQSR